MPIQANAHEEEVASSVIEYSTGEEIYVYPSQGDPDKMIVSIFSPDVGAVRFLMFFLETEYDTTFTDPVKAVNGKYGVIGHVGNKGGLSCYMRS